MRTTAILNLKGGVAKTTTTVNMAAVLAHDYKKRVLVIDADSQCNTTEFLWAGKKNKFVFTLADALGGGDNGAVAAAAAIEHSNISGVDLIPGDDSLMDLDLSKIESDLVDVNCLRELKKAVDYDHVFIDCPPAFNAAAVAALLMADDVLIPIKLDAFSLRGMANLTRQIMNMKKINPALRIAGLLPTMIYSADSIKASVDALKASKYTVFSGIRRTDKVDEMTFAQQPLIKSSPKSAACVDYRRFVGEFVGGENNGL